MRRSLILSLVIYVVVSFGALAATIAAGNTPHLGLDLQGGASVVLQPKGKATGGTIDQAIEIIRSRVDALGVAEPEIQRQGNSIIIQLPGVKNQQRALQIVGQTAQLLFRPVLQTLPPGEEPKSTPPEQDDPKATVILPERDRAGKVVRRFQLGPAELTGRAIAGATATIGETGRWLVDFETTGAGSGQWDEVAQRNFQKQIAIDL